MALRELIRKHFGSRPSLTKSELLNRRLDSIDVKKEKQLGKGSFGEVWKMTDKTGFTFALKTIDNMGILINTEPEKEYTIVKDLLHPRILRIYGFFKRQSELNLVMEYIDGGTLQKKINERGKLQLHDFYEMFEQIMDGLNCLHSNKIVHNDIKPENILCAADGSIKLSDFGLAKHCGSLSTEKDIIKQCLYYVSPEVAAGDTRTTQNDIWSVGATAVCMLRGNPPHHEKNINVVQRAIENYEIDDEIPEESQQASEIIKQCFKKPPQRPTAESLWNQVKHVLNKVPQEASDDWNNDGKSLADFENGLKLFNDPINSSFRIIAIDIGLYVAKLLAAAVLSCVFVLMQPIIEIDFSWDYCTLPIALIFVFIGFCVLEWPETKK